MALEGEGCGTSVDIDAVHAQEPSSRAPSEGESAGRPDFNQLLQMLKVEHESELSSWKHLQTQLQETEQELEETKSLLQSLQLELPTQQAEVEPEAEAADNFLQGTEQAHATETAVTNNEQANGKAKAQGDGKHHGFGYRIKFHNHTSSHITQSPTKEVILSKDQANELAMIKGWVHHPQTNKRHSRIFVHHDEKNLPGWRKKAIQLVNTVSFELLCAAAIITNAIVMGIQIDYSTRYDEDPGAPPIFFRVMDRIYLTWFVFELVLKMVAFGCSFWCRAGAAWNIFDFAIVITDVLQTVLELIFQDKGQRANFTFLRMLRMMRVTRAIKVVRLVRFFRELRIMVASVMKCGTSLMWSLLMFISIIYIFALLLLNSVAFYLHANPDDQYRLHYREYWSSVPQGMWTLYSCMTGGVSWMEVGDPLVHIGWVYGSIIGFYMYFTLFVVTNIITGIFVDTAIQNAQSDRDEVIQEELHSRDSARQQLKEIFEHADLDESGSLSIEELEEHLCDERVKAHLKSIGIQVAEAEGLFRLLDMDGNGNIKIEEFEEHLCDERVQAHLNSIGIKVAEAHGLFRLLDMDGNGNIKIEEFLFGCMRLKGGASSIDLATLMYENKRLAEGFKRFRTDVTVLLKEVGRKLDNKVTYQAYSI